MAKRSRRTRKTPLFEQPGSTEVDTLVTSKPHRDENALALHETVQTQYLNYALSVITSRALPDVRDGLKPVQRRILYTMWQQNLTAETRFRKCAKIVGDVMGNYHPHGDVALYETLVRMAQPFALRYPLVEGSGNFGSLDGDNAAAMRYTECRLAKPSTELLSELKQETVSFRPNYDGTKFEPVVLPARLPNLLINGATGIAVGMATNIPPHSLNEICTALLKLLENSNLSSVQLCRYVKGPEFPTGGQILNSFDEIKTIYETGSGSIRLRGTWESGPATRSFKTLYITSVPYTVSKAQLVARITDVALSLKLPPLLDVKDISTDDVKIALELKPDADEKKVMSYLFKHTPLQTSFMVNLTCLVPTDNPEISRPERVNLKSALWYFLRFRLEVTTKRLEYELTSLKTRIHILEGFEQVFDALDEVIKLIRRSDGKKDSADKIKRRFNLDLEQVNAILELRIYRLARLEILVIRDELTAKRKRALQIRGFLKHESRRWLLVRDEIQEIQETYADPTKDSRRTTIKSDPQEIEFSADDFIVDEDNVVLISRDGWIKRQKELRDAASTRLREGDSLLAVLRGSTRACVVFFSTSGVAYTSRIVDIPASTGHGEPIQRLFKLKDGEKIVAALSLDERIAPNISTAKKDRIPATHAVAVSSDGYALRFGLDSFAEPSNRAGRRFARLNENAEVVGVAKTEGTEVIIAATRQARAILCRINGVNYLSGPGKGVILLKILGGVDRVIGFILSSGNRRDLLTVETSRGATQTISTAKYEVTNRGGKGRELLQRGRFTKVLTPVTEDLHLIAVEPGKTVSRDRISD